MPLTGCAVPPMERAMVSSLRHLDRVPATVLTGFLGSGKTTLLNHLLHGEHDLRLAVVVNELGAVGIDGKIVQGGEAFVELDNGCLCCVLNAELDTTLRQLAQRGGFDHLVIETTGVADPLPIGWMFSRPGLSELFRLDAIVTVVDAANFARAVDNNDEALCQLRRADIVVLNKLDLVDDEGAAASALVRQHNALAPILPARFGGVPWELICTGRDAASNRASEAAGHAHGMPLESWVFQTQETFDEQALEDLLDEVPAEVYRAKGLVRTNAEWTWTLVNMVAGRIDLAAVAPEPEPSLSTLVFIGRSLNTSALAELCARFVK